jgi:F-type H+-transporting ATPase subunit b
VDWPHLISQIISFSIVCVLLHRFAYKPVLAILAERRRNIAAGLANAEKIKAELASTETQRHQVIQEANRKGLLAIEEARAAAARVGSQETEKALAAAEQILVKARQAAVVEHDRMLLDLKREVGRLVVQTAAACTGRVLTPEDENRLLAETSAAMGNGSTAPTQPGAS